MVIELFNTFFSFLGGSAKFTICWTRICFNIEKTVGLFHKTASFINKFRLFYERNWNNLMICMERLKSLSSLDQIILYHCWIGRFIEFWRIFLDCAIFSNNSFSIWTENMILWIDSHLFSVINRVTRSIQIMGYSFHGWERKTQPFDIYQTKTSVKACFSVQTLPFENMDCWTVVDCIPTIEFHYRNGDSAVLL